MLDADGAETTVMIIMQIRAADPARIHTHPYFSCLQGRHVTLLDLKVVRRVDDKSLGHDEIPAG
ncbi:hypothetical protein GCM10007207_01000 [Asaia siamensis]|uniref:Uncharacterized protein n=1 Tax=Asaia siamensis TaxID=110479 RepID=A0ABQ1L698_9PROT|nr:hypothetical protein GCM10007207_01000 [Asaia siamensis]